MTDGVAHPDDGTAERAGRPPGDRRAPRRAVRRGGEDPGASVRLRADDDLDIGWQPASSAAGDDDRLLRDVPPHW